MTENGTRSALLVIDLQVGMFDGKRLPPIHDAETLIARTQALLATARGSGTPVIFVRHGDTVPDDLLVPGTPGWEIHPAIAPLPGERIFDKQTPDSFHETGLADHLAQMGIERLVLCGAQTEFCVETTCRRAVELGYATVLVADAHSTWSDRAATAGERISWLNEAASGWGTRVVPAERIGPHLAILTP